MNEQEKDPVEGMKDVNRCFAEEGIPLTSNHLKMCFISDMYMKIKIKNYT